MFESSNGWTSVLQFGFLFLFIGIFVLYYFTQYNLLKNIQPQNRLMPAGNVFLQLIPIFGSIYAFIVVGKIADSIRLEADSREITSFGENDLLGGNDVLALPPLSFEEQRPTYNIGLAKCILGVCGFLPVVGNFINLAWFVCFIIYWIKLVKAKNIIQAV